MSCLPRWLVAILRRVLPLFGQQRPADLLKVTGEKSAYDYWQLVADRKELQRAWLAQMAELDVDVVLCPGAALAALPHGMSKDLSPSFSYNFMFNLLHVPCGCVPFTRVRSDETTYTSPHKDIWTAFAAQATAGSDSLPVGVQVSALPFRDELLMYALREVEACQDSDCK